MNAFILAHILPGIKIDGIFAAVILAVILAVLDAFVKPLLILLTLPATILTLGLFLFVINALIIMIAREIIPHQFHVDGFWHAMLFSIVLAFLNSFVHKRAFAAEKKND